MNRVLTGLLTGLLTCTFLAIADKHAPLKTMRVRSRSSPWITSELKDLMHY